MLSKVKSFALDGINGYPVDIEIDINLGVPSYETVGLPDTAIKESRERIRSAIKNSRLEYPIKRITINLAPADTKKEGANYDLPIAVGIIAANDGFETCVYKDYIILGELSLDGGVRKINGIMPLLIAGMQSGHKKFIIPDGNRNEAAYIDGIEAYAVKTLAETVEFLKDADTLEPIRRVGFSSDAAYNRYNLDFSEVKGQRIAKRALEIAVAGGHNVIMIGPPGAGKTMLAKCVPSIMPPMTYEEAVEVTKIHSIAGILDPSVGIVKTRPFRTPHHTATVPSLTGGGANCKPGEISLAHNGVLFLDEMPEYNRKTLETLRQPLEDGIVTISRAKMTLEYPSHFMLIASMNPCPCGNFGSKNQDTPCRCTPNEIHRYISKLSGPLLDRIDLQVEVDSVEYKELRSKEEEESSEKIRERIVRARDIQLSRYKGSGIYTNSQMCNSMMKKYCRLDAVGESVLENAFKKLALSARAGTRILKVARTIADLSGEENICVEHIAEAVQYRSLDRKYWE